MQLRFSDVVVLLCFAWYQELNSQPHTCQSWDSASELYPWPLHCFWLI